MVAEELSVSVTGYLSNTLNASENGIAHIVTCAVPHSSRSGLASFAKALYTIFI